MFRKHDPARWNGGWCPCGHEEGDWRDATDWTRKPEPDPYAPPDAPAKPTIYGVILHCRACGASYAEAWYYRRGKVKKYGNAIVSPEDSASMGEIEALLAKEPAR